MGFITSALCQILFVHGALQCYQARLEFSDQAFEDIDNAYHELNDADDIKKADIFRSPLDDDGKDRQNVNFETKHDKTAYADDDKEEVSEIRQDSEERRRGGQNQRAIAEKRRMSKQERMRTKHKHRLNHHSKGSDMLEDPVEEEPADRDREIANFYLTKSSDISNMSDILGPGPVSIQIIDPTTKVPTPSPAVIENSTILGLDDVNNIANISSENDGLVSFVGERKRGSKRKHKSHSSSRKGNDAFMNRNDEFIPVKQPKKESRLFHKHNSKLHHDERENINQKTGHKKRKHNKNHNEEINTRKNMEKYHLNDEERYANLSAINKSFKSAASKKFDLKNSDIDPLEDPGEESLDREELRERARMVLDKISDEDAKKLCLINAEREISEEEQTKLRDETSEVEKKTVDLQARSNPRKGIRTKIEHGDWVYQVTLLPLPDYSIRRNKTHNKFKLSSLWSRKKTPNDAVAGDKNQNSNNKYKNKKSEDTFNKGRNSLDKTSENVRGGAEPDKGASEYVSDAIVENYGETENKRDERDTESKARRHQFKLPKERGMFNRHTNINHEKGDEIYDVDTKNDEQSYSNFKNNDENTYGNHDISEKDEDSYEYDSLSGDEKRITELCMANRTTHTTLSTCGSTTEIRTTTKPTRKPNKPKSSLKPNDKPESCGANGNEFGQRNKTIDPYEMFLCGQLANSFVDEVLRKVKLSRKISRELGYTNETEETCDRCIELKPIKVPELAVMKNSLGKCLRSYAPVQNCSMCCGVPKPMARYLDVLVSFEKDNENSFYNKIQDDSTFIFTGDYPESLSKGGNRMKIKDKFEDEGQFNKDTFDRQRLREDLNEEKNEDKISNSNTVEKDKGKLNEDDYSSEDINSEDKGRNQKPQGEVKRYLRRFSKNKINTNKEETFSDLDENERNVEFSAGVNFPLSDPLVNEHSSNKGLDSNTHHRRAFGNIWNDVSDTGKENSHDTFNTPEEPEKKPLHNFDRFYGKSNYEYFKQYPAKNSPINSHPGYKFIYGDSLKNTSPKYSRDHNGFYKIPNSNRIYNKDDDLSPKNNYFGYSSKKYNQDQTMDLDAKYKGYRSKYDFLYDANGEYSLYPNLEEEDARMAGHYKTGEGENARMVKRDAESLPVYDDEPNVFFEIPDIEYDLYK